MASRYAAYVRGARQRAAEEDRRCRQHARRTRALLPELVGILRRYPDVKRVWLFGSLAVGGFHTRSDIDLAVEGLPKGALFRAGADLDGCAGDFHVDLVPMETAGESVRRRVREEGELLHADESTRSLRYLRLRSELEDETARLARLSGESADALRTVSGRPPTSLELRGLGALIHDFYTGVERVFRLIAPLLNGGLPEGEAWHRQLLRNMCLEIPTVRPPVLRPETGRALEEFLRFRHLFRHIYGFELEGERLMTLLARLEPVWQEVRRDLQGFGEFLEALSQ